MKFARVSKLPRVDRSPTPPFIIPCYAEAVARMYASAVSQSPPDLTPTQRYDKRVKQYLDLSASESE